jgi:DHA1 family bicyclomycin/chloramphenicol resistance-like MFS transporter
MALSSVGNGMSQPPNIAAGLSVNPRLAGSASGLMGFLQMMASALGTWLIGYLPRDTVLSLVVIVGFCLAAAFLCGLGALRASGPDLPLATGPRLGKRATSAVGS